MSGAEPKSVVWEPLTPRGVAAFAYAANGRLWLVQFAVTLVVALAIISFLNHAWFPIVRQAIQHLPDEGEIRSGQLSWRGSSPHQLAEGTYLAFSVDLDHTGGVRSPADVEIELGEDSCYVRSILGYLELPYPRGWVISFNREGLGPWWNAWSPMLLALVALGVVVGLLLIWALLAAVYMGPVRLLLAFVNHLLTWPASWRLAGAALMPGALLMAGGIWMYGWGVVDLVGLIFIAVGHIVLGWVYLFITPLFLQSSARVAPKNPFSRPDV